MCRRWASVASVLPNQAAPGPAVTRPAARPTDRLKVADYFGMLAGVPVTTTRKPYCIAARSGSL